MLNNNRIITLCRVLSFLLIGIILIDIFFSRLSGSLSTYFEGHWPALTSGGILVVLVLLNPRYFSLSDDHEFIQIRSRSALWPFAENPAEVNYDIPKKYIGDFHIINRGLRSLIKLDLNTSYRGQRQYSFDISAMSGDKTERLRELVQRALRKPTAKAASQPVPVNS